MKILFKTTYNATRNKWKLIHLLPSLSIHFDPYSVSTKPHLKKHFTKKYIQVNFHFLIFWIYIWIKY